MENKSKLIKKELHKIGISANVSSIKWDYWHAALSRGDESFTDFLIEVYTKGGKLGAFKEAAVKNNINSEYYASENYSFEKTLHLDFIDVKPGKEFLIQEAERLLSL